MRPAPLDPPAAERWGQPLLQKKACYCEVKGVGLGDGRLLRVEYPGAIYHVTIRGNNRRVLFLDDEDRGRFLERLGEYREEYAVRVYAFCLMTNHVHLVVETPNANLGRFLHRLQTAYTTYFNLRHGQSGHLTEGRYGAKAVEGDEYLLKLARYVQLNPVFVEMLEDAGPV